MPEENGSSAQRSQWTIHYKMGHNHRWLTIWAKDKQEAAELGKKYTDFIGGRENVKCQLIGNAYPAVLDIDKEIERLKSLPHQELTIYPGN